MLTPQRSLKLLPASFGFAFMATLAAMGQPPADREAPRPISAVNTVFLEEMTWMETRDALAFGTTTIIIPIGGIE